MRLKNLGLKRKTRKHNFFKSPYQFLAQINLKNFLKNYFITFSFLHCGGKKKPPVETAGV